MSFSNHLSDWTSEEYAKINGLRLDRANETGAAYAHNERDEYLDELLNDDTPVPDSFDWRAVKGRVTPVKNQGGCGSCWAFSATGVLEGQEYAHLINKSEGLISLSEQELVDCSSSNFGCGGGSPSHALTDIAKLGGIVSNQNYPYVDANRKCQLDRSKVVMKTKGYMLLPKNDEDALKKVVYRYGPVSTGIYATKNLLSYHSGILNDDICQYHQAVSNHAVLVVGYGTDKATKKDYWIVKNSWGSDWGMEGYVHMSRNADNQCNIATFAAIARF